MIDQGIAPNPEVFLIDNTTKPPVSDQFSIGVRQRLGAMTLSASYSGVRSRNGFTFLFGNRRPDGTCCQGIPGFSNILISSDAKRTWYDALFFQADKPLGGDRIRYGFSLTYTLADAKQNGGDLFSLDYPTVEDYPRYPTNTDERHRVVATGIVQVPWNVYLSTLITLGSGTPYNIDDQSQGGGVNERQFIRNGGRPDQFWFIFPDAWAYRSVDFRFRKDFPQFNGTRLGVTLDMFNVFNYKNFGCYDTGFQSPTLGDPSCTVGDPRRVQLGAEYNF